MKMILRFTFAALDALIVWAASYAFENHLSYLQSFCITFCAVEIIHSVIMIYKD